MRPKVLVTCPQAIGVLESGANLNKNLEFTLRRPLGQAMSSIELENLIVGYHALICGDDDIDGAALSKGDDLRLVVKWGQGTDNVDQKALSARGISFSNTPGLLSSEVADMAVGMLLSLLRGVHHVHSNMQRGTWTKFEGESLGSLVVGILGMGGVGREVSRRLSAFGCAIRWYDPFAKDVEELGARVEALEDFLATCDVIVLCADLNNTSSGLINEKSIIKMVKSPYIVNVARGGLVIQADLEAALKERRLRGAALDVFESEPFLPAGKLEGLEGRLLLGSHNASNTRQANLRVTDAAVRIVEEHFLAMPEIS